jgi:DNA polymerase-3 subunit epsilon
VRQIVLDTETTGLHPELGHRIIEVGAVELIDRRLTGRTLQFHLDPEREIDKEAVAVHGKRWEDLRGQPKFADVAHEILAFTDGAEWICHNAPFDIAFMDRELGLAGLRRNDAGVVDTIALIKELSGKRASLDSLCDRFKVNRTRRVMHGALLDSELLAEVYLAMTRSQQSMDMSVASRIVVSDAKRVALLVTQPSAEELAEHAAYLAEMQKGCSAVVWLQA